MLGWGRFAVKSGRSKQFNSRSPSAPGWFDRLRQRLFPATVQNPDAPPATWEDEDFLQADPGSETSLDPWHDDLPERRSIPQETDEPKTPESPPNDAFVDRRVSLPDDAVTPPGTEDVLKPSTNAEPPDLVPEPSLSISPDFGERLDALEERVRAESAPMEESEAAPVVDVRDGAEESDFDVVSPERSDMGSMFDDKTLNLFDDEDSNSAHFGDPDAEAWTEHLEPVLDFEIELFDYDPEARQRVWNDESEDVADSPIRAQHKAAEIVSRLSFTSQRERKANLRWLIDLFRHHDHGATYRAILTAVDSGVTSETLRNMAALRDVWADRTEWWLGRYGWARSVRPLHNGGNSLTWKLDPCNLRGAIRFSTGVHDRRCLGPSMAVSTSLG